MLRSATDYPTNETLAPPEPARWRMLNLTWVSFFLTFVVWFNLAPFASTIAKALRMTALPREPDMNISSSRAGQSGGVQSEIEAFGRSRKYDNRPTGGQCTNPS